MSISSKQKAVILSIVVIAIGGAAFAYFDPLDLDLLGLKSTSVSSKSTTAKPAAPGAALQAGKPPATTSTPKAVTSSTPVPLPAGMPAGTPAPKATPAPAAMHNANPVAAPATASLPVPAGMPAGMPAPKTAPAPAAMSSANSVAAVLAPAVQPAKSFKKSPSEAVYPPSVDLRHCLDQPTPQEIAKCAGE